MSTILDFTPEFGGGTIDFHLFYPRYGGGTLEFCLFLARIWGGDIAIFFLKLGVWGGCSSVCSKMGGVRIWRPKGADLAHPPPQDVFGTFPKVNNATHFLFVCFVNSFKRARVGFDFHKVQNNLRYVRCFPTLTITYIVGSSKV